MNVPRESSSQFLFRYLLASADKFLGSSFAVFYYV